MKKLIWIIAALAIALGSFLLGGVLAGRASQMRLQKTNHYLLMLNNIPRYSTSAEISLHIANKRYDHAKCIADVTASLFYREIQTCLVDKNCRDGILEEVQKTAPELLTGDKSKFAYYDSLEKCTFVEKEK